MPNYNKKVPLWFPYTSSIEIKKNNLTFNYKGGSYSTNIKNILSIMLYGNTCDLKEEFLYTCCQNNIPICLHRRNLAKAVWITPSFQTGKREDILTKQIIFRANERKRTHITKKLLQAKFKSMSWLINGPVIKKGALSQKELINIEAQHAKRYWEKYYSLLGYPKNTRRNKNNELSKTLDAVSKLISGIILRYITYHKMSPFHGFLHITSDYPSLVYDLMEPYRGYIEKNIFETIKKIKKDSLDENCILPFCITATEDYLDKNIYTDTTRQIVTFQELLHGSVLSLRAYLLGNSRQFILPIPGKPNGGRPKKVGYKLYGREAGPTDFWEKANDLAKKQF